MKILKWVGFGVVGLSLLGGAVATFVAIQDPKNISELPFMFIAGLSLFMFVIGLAMLWMSKKGDPFEEAIAAINEPDPIEESKRGWKAMADADAAQKQVIPTASLSVIEQLMARNAQLERDNAELQVLVKAYTDDVNAGRFHSEPRAQLTFEEELEEGKKAYYKSIKEKPAPQPMSIQEANEYSTASRKVQITAPPTKEILERYQKEKAAEADSRQQLPPRSAPPASKPEKVKIKFELPFFGKKKAKLRSILDEEEKKLEAEEAIGRQKYGA